MKTHRKYDENNVFEDDDNTKDNDVEGDYKRNGEENYSGNLSTIYFMVKKTQ